MSELMRRGAQTMAPQKPLRDAALIMQALDASALPVHAVMAARQARRRRVQDSGSTAFGTISPGDLALRQPGGIDTPGRGMSRPAAEDLSCAVPG